MTICAGCQQSLLIGPSYVGADYHFFCGPGQLVSYREPESPTVTGIVYDGRL